MDSTESRNGGSQSKKRVWIEIAGYLLDKFSKLINIDRLGSWTIETTYIELVVSNLPQEFADFRLVQISDFHFGSWLNQEFLVSVIDRVNRLEPDLVTITGDFVSFFPQKYSQALVNCLAALKTKEQTLAVLGNHDHWADAGEVRRVLARCQIRELNNHAIALRRDTSVLYIAGIDDALCELDGLDKVLYQIPTGAAAILLAHEPDFADISAPTKRFQLQLSGHSHGSQMRLPLINRVFLPSLAKKYPAGLYQIEGMYLYTNRGIGATWLNLRYNCSPEITLFTLKTKTK